VQNNITGVVTCPGRTAHVTWSQAWRFRKLMTREFRTEIYLLTGDELRMVRSEGGSEEQPMDVGGTMENSPVHSPRGGLAVSGLHFFVPTASRPNSVSPLTVESRPTSPATTVVRALSPPTRLPLVVAAGGHSSMVPLGGDVYNLVGGSTTGGTGPQSTSFDRRLLGRHSERALRRLLPRNSDGADDRLCWKGPMGFFKNKIMNKKK